MAIYQSVASYDSPKTAETFGKWFTPIEELFFERDNQPLVNNDRTWMYVSYSVFNGRQESLHINNINSIEAICVTISIGIHLAFPLMFPILPLMSCQLSMFFTEPRQ